MKPILMILLAWLMSISLLTSCKKESNDSIISNNAGNPAANKTADISGANVSAATLAANTQGMITYKLGLEQSANSLVSWNSGYITSVMIAFEGFQTRGNAMFRVYNETQTGQQANLFTNAVLGNIPAVPGIYNEFNFTTLLGQAGSSYPLYLTGIYKAGDKSVPVQLVVSDPVQLKAQLTCCNGLSNGLTIAPNQNYTELLLLNMGNITKGITAEMLMNATLSNGVIVIATGSNQQLYQLILTNLATNIDGSFTGTGNALGTPILAPSPTS